jgi:hypothetical protein
MDKSGKRAYMNPTADSQRNTQSRRFTNGTRTHNQFKEIDEMELTKISAEELTRERRNAQHEDPMMITKTVAWRVDETSEKDSGSTDGPHTLRDML